ncbi:P-loop containing nucleoside triphosphate hydrolase protein [Dendrothele bispora CBS 962.96]|uniref:RNA helicase n=1 Tax=Dendrothele bispora (strain CBS 962.96) TaxID=1314807 RepID=A0A4S8MV63_DENBC|nr:P-loop containing nucleoside triphosphate hydrolase protein [Dendrothele bispora CBS 962.96]
MPKQLCQTFLAEGTCSNRNCEFEHNVLSCEVCGILLPSEKSYREHMRSRKHLRRTDNSTSDRIHYCTVCARYFYDSNSWQSHVKSKKHLTKASQRGVSHEVEPEYPIDVPGKRFCILCERHVKKSSWKRHDKSSEHESREKFVVFKSAMDEAQGDKNGATVSGEFDFKVVEPSDALEGVSVTGKIEASEPLARFTLVGCQLAPSGGHAAHSPFKVTLVGTNRTIAHGLPLSFTKLKTTTIPQHLAELLETGTTKEIIDNLRTLYLPAFVNCQTYSQHFKYLLWVEEVQMERDLERYDIHDAKLMRHASRDVVSDRPTSYYYLKVPGLAEKRPSVLRGDRIHAQHCDATDKGRWFEGIVHIVCKEEVGLRFTHSFSANPSDRFQVRFKLNKVPLMRQHHVLDDAFPQDRVLFPTQNHMPTTPIPRVHENGTLPMDLRLRNISVRANEPQLQAVLSIVSSAPGSLPFVIFGPPGTGKTVTMVEAIFQILHTNPSARILACAPSNSAADIIASRLRASNNSTTGTAGGLTKEELFRAYAPSRSKSEVPSELLGFTYCNPSGHFSVPVERISSFRVIVTTCVSASIVSVINMKRGHFSHIFIDEAGQATEPEVMVSIRGMADKKTNVVLSGDPKQLGPVIRSTVASQLELGKSFIERLMESEVYDEESGYGRSVVKLVKNFRSHPAILKFPNEQFYRGDLQACGNSKIINHFLASRHLVDRCKKFPIVFHSISGKDNREASSPSFFNIDEVTMVKGLVEKLRADKRLKLNDDDIGVIAPYHAQVLKLRAALKTVADSVKVGSVEEFQGQERRVIIISTVRSSREFVEYDLRHTLGFVANPRRFNVAVTRAQAFLCIVGDPSVLSLDPLWRSFLNYIHVNGGWSGPGPTWDTSEPVDEAGGYDAAVRSNAVDDMNEFTRRMESMTLSEVRDEDGDGDGDETDEFDDAVDSPGPWVEVE